MKITAIRPTRAPDISIASFSNGCFALFKADRVLDCYRMARDTTETVGDSVRARMVNKLRKSGAVK